MYTYIYITCACCVFSQSCLTFCNPMDCSPPRSSVHGILQARILEQVVISSSRGLSQPRYSACISYISCIARKIFEHWATWDSLMKYSGQFSSVQSLSRVRLSATQWIAARQSSLSINSWSLLKLMPIKSVMSSSHLILCHPLLLLRPIPPSIRVISNESTLHMRWPKYWSFSFSISPSNEHPGLISFRMDWLDRLVVQGTLKSLLQHHSSKASFFGAQFSSRFNSHIHTWLLEKP